MNRRLLHITLIATFVLLLSCQKDDNMANPFDGEVVNQDTVRLEITEADANSIAGIYKNIFKPTCSNVGCHDGTFEPDFRTIESAYNTLVYQEPIKNDGNYSFRVEPYNPSSSVILARLEDRLAPPMPIQIEPDSDWPEKRSEYIDNIRTWIEAGAPDITGTVRTRKYPRPILLGAGAVVDGEWRERSGGSGPIFMPRGEEDASLYFAFRHDNIDPGDLTYNKIAFSTNPNVFDSTQVVMDLEIMSSTRAERGFYGDIVDYTHRVQFDPQVDLDPDEEQWYFRVYVQDDENDVTEIPTDNGIFYVKSYMSYIWQD